MHYSGAGESPEELDYTISAHKELAKAYICETSNRHSPFILSFIYFIDIIEYLLCTRLCDRFWRRQRPRMDPHTRFHLKGPDWWWSASINAGSYITTQRDSKEIRVSEARGDCKQFPMGDRSDAVEFREKALILGSTKKQKHGC